MTLLLLTACLPPDLADWELDLLDDLRIDRVQPIETDPDLVALGLALYVDEGLSNVDGGVPVSCLTCHDLCLDEGCDGPLDGAPSGVDPRGGAVSQGAGGETGRNAPTVLYSAYRDQWGWIGRYCDLDAQILFPLESAGAYNQGAHAPKASAARVRQAHREDYERAFGPIVDAEVHHNVGLALAELLRDLPAPPSRVDRYLDGEADALDATELWGASLFVGKAHCVECHSGPMLSDGDFHAVLPPGPDLGRAEDKPVCRPDELREPYLFQTPTLRAIGRTAPYMHDGRFDSLWEVIETYDEGGSLHGPEELRAGGLHLDDDEKVALEAFLLALEPL